MSTAIQVSFIPRSKRLRSEKSLNISSKVNVAELRQVHSYSENVRSSQFPLENTSENTSKRNQKPSIEKEKSINSTNINNENMHPVLSPLSPTKIDKSARIEYSHLKQTNKKMTGQRQPPRLFAHGYSPCCISLLVFISLLILSGLAALILAIIDINKQTINSTKANTNTIVTLTTTTTPTIPTANSSLPTFCGCTNFTLSLTNILFNTTGVIYQWQSSLRDQNLWSNISTPSSSSTLPVSYQSNATDYRCIIFMSYPSIIILTSTTVTVVNAFCAPKVVNCSSGDSINNFVLVGELSTAINDLSTNCSSGSYKNSTSFSVTLYLNSTYHIMTTTQYSSSEYFAVWIDFNDNCVFEPVEKLATVLYGGTSNTLITITIPLIGSGGALGVHRMRTVAAYANPTPNPCANSITYGETHDYSVNILTNPLNTVRYSQPFTHGNTSSSQCTAWTSFVAQLTVRPYTSLTLLGSNDPIGVTLTNLTIIANIAAALRTSTSYGPVTANGRSWLVALCGSGYELSASGTACQCASPGYIVRPCIGNTNWGGIGSTSCSAVTQIIIVIFKYEYFTTKTLTYVISYVSIEMSYQHIQ